MSMSDSQWEAVYQHWNTTPAPDGMSESQYMRNLFEQALENSGGTPVDRRAELLELASRLAAVVMARDDVAIEKISGEPFAAVNVRLAVAIIAEVDRVSGEVKP